MALNLITCLNKENTYESPRGCCEALVQLLTNDTPEKIGGDLDTTRKTAVVQERHSNDNKGRKASR